MSKIGEVWVVYKVVLEVVINGFWLFVYIFVDEFIRKVYLEGCYFWFLSFFFLVIVERIVGFCNKEYLRFFDSLVLISVVNDIEKFMDIDIGYMNSVVLELKD